MEKTKQKKVYREFKIELEKQDADRLYHYCTESDMKYTSVFRRSLRKFLEFEEQKKLSEI
jgi:hypothetical protein